jgi:hypothetical protein
MTLASSLPKKDTSQSPGRVGLQNNSLPEQMDRSQPESVAGGQMHEFTYVGGCIQLRCSELQNIA